MASNVFGVPITNSTLKGMPEYASKENITRSDRAHVAMNMKHGQDKDTNARKFVENLKVQWGDGVSTLCLLYNASGDPVRLVTSQDWYGHIGPSPYPTEIGNGQWGAFLHVKTTAAASGSVGAVVYRCLNDACDWMVAWHTPWNRPVFDNKVYTEIRNAGHFDGTVWGVVNDKMMASGYQHTDTWNGVCSTVSTGGTTSPTLEAFLTLEHAA